MKVTPAVRLCSFGAILLVSLTLCSRRFSSIGAPSFLIPLSVAGIAYLLAIRELFCTPKFRPRVILIGLSPAHETVEVELPALFGRRARILVSHGGDHLPQEDFPRLAQWALEGTLDLAGMVTRTAALDEWEDALDLMQGGEVIRSVLIP